MKSRWETDHCVLSIAEGRDGEMGKEGRRVGCWRRVIPFVDQPTITPSHVLAEFEMDLATDFGMKCLQTAFAQHWDYIVKTFYKKCCLDIRQTEFIHLPLCWRNIRGICFKNNRPEWQCSGAVENGEEMSLKMHLFFWVGVRGSYLQNGPMSLEISGPACGRWDVLKEKWWPEVIIRERISWELSPGKTIMSRGADKNECLKSRTDGFFSVSIDCLVLRFNSTQAGQKRT
ncbi:hypothetical protein B0H14DRAFT_3151026 [Mycena olivaceomarginata]|nr:hypothetical protein B0H14DRAFT_3151026 [Mycena olivaceomarginata]